MQLLIIKAVSFGSGAELKWKAVHGGEGEAEGGGECNPEGQQKAFDFISFSGNHFQNIPAVLSTLRRLCTYATRFLCLSKSPLFCLSIINQNQI